MQVHSTCPENNKDKDFQEDLKQGILDKNYVNRMQIDPVVALIHLKQ